MRFDQVDPQFFAWAEDHGLRVATSYKDEDVRSVQIMKSTQSKWQLWLEPDSTTNECVIRYWNYRDQSHSVICKVENLGTKLESIYAKIVSKHGYKGIKE